MERLPAPAFLPADSRIYGTLLPGCSEQAGRWAGGEPPTQDLRARARAGRGPGQGEGKEGRVASWGFKEQKEFGSARRAWAGMKLETKFGKK